MPIALSKPPMVVGFRADQKSDQNRIPFDVDRKEAINGRLFFPAGTSWRLKKSSVSAGKQDSSERSHGESSGRRPPQPERKIIIQGKGLHRVPDVIMI